MSHRLAILSMVVVMLPAAAWAQPTQVEPGIGDRGPLQLSPKSLSVDLRKPRDFDSVYRLGGEGSAARFARINGALLAVFPRSVYGQSEGGVVPIVPAGTVFYIGTPVAGSLPGLAERPAVSRAPAGGTARFETLAPSGLMERAESATFTRAETLATSEPTPVIRESDSSRMLSVMTDDDYCRERVQSLLLQAAAKPR